MQFNVCHVAVYILDETMTKNTLHLVLQTMRRQRTEVVVELRKVKMVNTFFFC